MSEIDDLYAKGLHQAIVERDDEIARLKALLPQWVSVDERLPIFKEQNGRPYDVYVLSQDNDYICSVERDGISRARMLYFNHLGEFEAYSEDTVTHWMPLPPAPEAAK